MGTDMLHFITHRDVITEVATTGSPLVDVDKRRAFYYKLLLNRKIREKEQLIVINRAITFTWTTSFPESEGT